MKIWKWTRLSKLSDGHEQNISKVYYYKIYGFRNWCSKMIYDFRIMLNNKNYANTNKIRYLWWIKLISSKIGFLKNNEVVNCMLVIYNF